jgi:exodeoxyribonuclease VIII
MLDLETMGTGPDAAITAIGAAAVVLGDGKSDGKIVSDFYEKVDLASSVEAGGTMDPNTVVWWLGQGPAARSAMTADGISINDALRRFSHWVYELAGLGEPKRPTRVWGMGATFDNVILTSAYKQRGRTRPWTYRDDRCFRTLEAMYPDVPRPDNPNLHNALADARAQAEQLIAISQIATHPIT